MHVLLCRARQDSEATRRKLAAAGHSAILGPVIEIVGLDADLTRIGGIDALLMTSAHAAEMLGDAGVARWAGCPLYAVGRRTAAAARTRGFREILIGDGDAIALLALLTETRPVPAHLLYLAGRIRKPLLEGELRRAGYRMSVAEIYDTREASGWDKAVCTAIAQGSIQICLHFSQRSAELALRFAAKEHLASAFAELRHICMSDDVASPLTKTGITKIYIASQPNENSLLQEIREI